MGTVVGLDPGQRGGFGVLADGQPVYAAPLPILDKKVDVRALHTMLDLYQPDQVVIELQSIRGGQAGAMAIGANYGRLLAMIEFGVWPHRVITPLQWSKSAGIRSGLKGRAKKDAAFAAALRLWGSRFEALGLRQSQDGPVEALLIALYSS